MRSSRRRLSPPVKLAAAAKSGDALVYVANALGGGFWAKMMALSIALSVIANTGTGIVLSARIAYGMGSYRALPGFLSNVILGLLPLGAAGFLGWMFEQTL